MLTNRPISLALLDGLNTFALEVVGVWWTEMPVDEDCQEIGIGTLLVEVGKMKAEAEGSRA